MFGGKILCKTAKSYVSVYITNIRKLYNYKIMKARLVNINIGYFKGWYFKCSTKDKTIAFIPAYHYSNNKKSASLQIITDEKAFNIPFEKLEYTEKPLYVKIGNCIFSERGITLDFQSNDLTLKGVLDFKDFSPIGYDIMGPFKYVPFMQCRHSVYSMRHKINGQITVNDQLYKFENGIGYVEGDRGHSFPKKYIWTQCCFKNNSLMLSVADIPFLGSHFTGIIGVVLFDEKEHRIATYLGARITQVDKNTVMIKQGSFEFTAKLLKKNAQPLAAPSNGDMCRTIHESAACEAYYRFSHKDRVLCEFTTDKASFEFEYN